MLLFNLGAPICNSFTWSEVSNSTFHRFARVLDQERIAVTSQTDPCFAFFVQFDPLLAADGLDRCVPKEDGECDRKEDGEKSDGGCVLDRGVASLFQSFQQRGWVFGDLGGYGDLRVQDVGLVPSKVVDFDGVQIREWIRRTDAAGEIWDTAVVDNVCVEDSVRKLGQCGHEDGSRIGENGQQRSTGVSKGVGDEELLAGDRKRVGAQVVVCTGPERGPG